MPISDKERIKKVESIFMEIENKSDCYVELSYKMYTDSYNFTLPERAHFILSQCLIWIQGAFILGEIDNHSCGLFTINETLMIEKIFTMMHRIRKRIQRK